MMVNVEIQLSPENDAHRRLDFSNDLPHQTAVSDLPVGSARSNLLTILGELVFPNGDAVWTSSLLYVMTGLGLEEQTARQAIARMADAGLIAGEKCGRTVRWSITDEGRARIVDVNRRAASLINPPRRWDGQCLILAVSVPQHRRAIRHRLYNELYWQGFGNPAPGLWASPHLDRIEELERLIDELGLRETTISFVGGTLGVGLTEPEIVARAWDLKGIALRYERMIEAFSDLDPTPGDGLLFAHIALVREFNEFPAVDPQLPEDLLPDWVGRRAARLFVERERRWSGRAHQRWLEIVRATAPG